MTTPDRLVSKAERAIEAILAQLEVDTRRPVRHIEIRVGRKGAPDPGRSVWVSLIDVECVTSYGLGWRGLGAPR